MANYYKVLAQSKPTANTETDAYTVPSSTSTVVSSIVITNIGESPAFYNIVVAPAGAGTTEAMYIAKEIGIPSRDAIALTLGLTLATTDKVRVLSSTGLVNFNIFGSEIA